MWPQNIVGEAEGPSSVTALLPPLCRPVALASAASLQPYPGCVTTRQAPPRSDLSVPAVLGTLSAHSPTDRPEPLSQHHLQSRLVMVPQGAERPCLPSSALISPFPSGGPQAAALSGLAELSSETTPAPALRVLLTEAGPGPDPSRSEHLAPPVPPQCSPPGGGAPHVHLRHPETTCSGNGQNHV